MARTLTPRDAHTIINSMVKQITGQQTITATDTSSFVSAGELVMSYGTENVINTLNIVLARTIVASRPYAQKIKLMEVNDGVYSNRVRKVSFYSKDAKASGHYNTNLFTNLSEGFTAGENEANGVARSTKSQWEQSQPVALEMNFGGCSTWQDCITMYEDQLKIAFTGENEFIQFVNGYLTEHANDIVSQKEAFNRMALINKIASVYDMSADMPNSVINLTSAFNTFYGTNYTSAQLRSDYLKDFLAFFVATFKEVSDYMSERSVDYHWSPAKTVDGVSYKLLRHTPKDRQMVYLFAPLFRKAEALVLPEIFNPNMLNIATQYEPITYWQSNDSEADRAKISCTPAVNDTITGLQKAGNAVSLDYVVGMITDRDGLVTNFQLESSRTTVLEARKGYRNTWNTFAKNICSDNTEKCVIFIMAD